MFPRAVEDIPPLITDAVLDAYANYVIANAGPQTAPALGSPEVDSGRQTFSQKNVPSSLEEALAPLEILFGKTALSAVGIALHGNEGIVRYVERQPYSVPEEDSPLGKDTDQRSPGESSLTHGDPRRCLYRVGEHTLFSPMYCPCSAYAFQSIRREEGYYCKHLLALQLALKLEGTGIRQDNIITREVDPGTFEALLLHELS